MYSCCSFSSDFLSEFSARIFALNCTSCQISSLYTGTSDKLEFIISDRNVSKRSTHCSARKLNFHLFNINQISQARVKTQMQTNGVNSWYVNKNKC